MAKLKSGTRVYGDAQVDQTLTVGNITISGNLTVNGTTTSVDSTVTRVEDPIFELGGGANGAALTTDDGKERGILMHYFNGSAKDAFMGWHTSNGQFEFGAVASEVNGDITVATYGNVKAGHFIGEGDTLGNITGANVTGWVAQANYANYAGQVTQSTQSNITLLGTQTSLTVSGTSNIADVNANGVVNLTNTSVSTSTTSGALKVAGGAGIVGDLWVGGTIHGAISGSTSAPGANTDIVFNDGGTSNATGGFTFDKTSNTVTVGADITLHGDTGVANIGGNINLGGHSVVDTNNTGIELYSGNYAQLNYNSAAWVWVDNNGAHLETSGGNVTLDNNGDLTVDTGNLKLPSANVTKTGSADFVDLKTTGTGTAGTANLASVIARDLSEDQIPYINGASRLTGTNDFTYAPLSSTLTVPTANIANVNSTTLKVSGLTTGHVTYATTDGQLTDSTNLTFDGTTLSVPNVTMSGTANAANVVVSTLTQGRVTYAGTNGKLVDSSSLTFDGSILSVPTANANINATNANVSSLTSTGIVVAGSGGALTTDSGITYSTGTLSVTSGISTGTLTATTGNITTVNSTTGNITTVNSTTGNITTVNATTVVATTGNITTINATTLNASGDANITGNLHVGGVIIADGNITGANVTTTGGISASGDLTAVNGTFTGTLAAGDTTITGNLTVTGTTTSVNTTVTQLTDPLFDLGNGANGAALTTNDGMDRGLVMHTYVGASGSGTTNDLFMGWDNSNSTFVLAKHVTVTDNVVDYGADATAQQANLADLIMGNIHAYNANFGGVVFSNGNVTLGAGSTFNGNLNGNVSGSFKVTGGAGAIQFADSSNILTSSSGLNFDSTSNTLTVGNTVSATNVSATNLTGTLTTAAQPNVTSLGTLTGLSVSGNVSVTANVSAGNVLTDNLLYANGQPWDLQQAAGLDTYIQYNEGNNFSASSNFTFDPASNTFAVTGTANVSGNVNAGDVYVSSLTSGRVSFVGTNGKLVDSANLTFNSTSNTLTTVTGNITTVNASNVSVSSLTGGRITFASNTNKLVDDANLTFDGTVLTVPTANVVTLNSGNITNTGDIVSGNVYANAGTVKATTLTGTLSTASQPNVTSLGTLTSLTVSGQTSLGPIANVSITGGTSGQVIVTDGSGGLSFATNDTSRIVNGTSNVSIPTADGAVDIVVAGTTIVEVSGTGANVTGVVTATGDIQGQNITATANLVAQGTTDATNAATGAIHTDGGISAKGNIYAGKAVGFAVGSGNTDSAAYIQYNSTSGSLDFIFN